MRLGRLVSAFTLTVLAAGTAYAAGAGDGAIALPLPGSLVLLSSGVAGLAGLSWWLRRKK
jgi:hypothetical protein